MVNNKISTAYFREQNKYFSFDSFKKELNIEDNSLVEEIIERLSYRKLIKPTTQEEFNLAKVNEDFDDEIELGKITSGSTNGFTFDFVGVAYISNCIIKCYPKYIDDDCSQEEFDKKYKEHFKKVLQTIKKFNQEKQQRVHFYNGELKSENFNRLSVMLYILNDYLENGVYTNQKTIIETNGEGEIDWDKTINETFALIKNNQPYYFDLQTINTVNNDEDFIKQVHECIISDCSRELLDTGILDIFDLRGEEITSLTLNDLGDKEYIKYKLENELKNQFITKKQNLLKTLYAYVNESENGFDNSDFSFYGVHKFATVWEQACSEIFDNIRDERIGKLRKTYPDVFGETKLRNPNYAEDNKDTEPEFLKDSNLFKDLIENAKWIFNKKALRATKTLEPDTLVIYDKGFYILDSKYYYIEHTDTNIYHQPGIQDVVKQFAYHKAFSDFIENTNIDYVRNAFLIPKKVSDDSKAEFNVIGEVKLDLMQQFAMKKLGPISVVELDPEFVYKNYLNGTKCKSELKLLENTRYKDKIESNLYANVAEE